MPVDSSIINWLLVTLVGLMVWLVKRLVDNNQKILDSLKDENKEERKLHREDVSKFLEDSQENRDSSERNFDKVVTALGKLTDKLDNLIVGNDD